MLETLAPGSVDRICEDDDFGVEFLRKVLLNIVDRAGGQAIGDIDEARWASSPTRRRARVGVRLELVGAVGMACSGPRPLACCGPITSATRRWI
jgi:hypothetical protein